MGIYLVDYENVHNDGVTDIQKLSASDRVVIFYGDSIKSIPFETHVEMMASKAAIEYIETHKVAKNYLDFQLATYLGFLIGKGEKGPVYIISQDTGFDSIVDFWRGRNIEAFRQPSIASPSTPKDVSLKKGIHWIAISIECLIIATILVVTGINQIGRASCRERV